MSINKLSLKFFILAFSFLSFSLKGHEENNYPLFKKNKKKFNVTLNSVSIWNSLSIPSKEQSSFDWLPHLGFNYNFIPSSAIGFSFGLEDSEEIDFSFVGLNYTYAFNKKYMSTGIQIKPFLGYHSHDNGFKVSQLGSLASYQWMMKNGFNMQVGLGGQYLKVDSLKDETTSHQFALATELNFGFAF